MLPDRKPDTQGSIDEQRDQIKRIISEKLDKPMDTIADEAIITEDLGADSLDLVELIMALEDRFGAQIEDKYAEVITRVKHVWEYLDLINEKDPEKLEVWRQKRTEEIAAYLRQKSTRK